MKNNLESSELAALDHEASLIKKLLDRTNKKKMKKQKGDKK